jgi:hypothetical protein
LRFPIVEGSHDCEERGVSIRERFGVDIEGFPFVVRVVCTRMLAICPRSDKDVHSKRESRLLKGRDDTESSCGDAREFDSWFDEDTAHSFNVSEL